MKKLTDISKKIDNFNIYSDYNEIVLVQNELIELFREARDIDLGPEVLTLLSQTEELLEACFRPRLEYKENNHE